jgi:hypothetical protein
MRHITSFTFLIILLSIDSCRAPSHSTARHRSHAAHQSWFNSILNPGCGSALFPDPMVFAATGGIPTSPDNGTPFINASSGDSFIFSFENGSLFGVYAVDLAPTARWCPMPPFSPQNQAQVLCSSLVLFHSVCFE